MNVNAEKRKKIPQYEIMSKISTFLSFKVSSDNRHNNAIYSIFQQSSQQENIKEIIGKFQGFEVPDNSFSIEPKYEDFMRIFSTASWDFITKINILCAFSEHISE